MAIGLLFVSAQGVNVDSGFYAACAGLRAQSQALAQAIAARGGIGIAQLILRHLQPPKVSGGS